MPSHSQYRIEVQLRPPVSGLGIAIDLSLLNGDTLKGTCLADGAVADQNQINAYIDGGRPTCPAGGKYKYGVINTDPTCSVPGHRLQPR